MIRNIRNNINLHKNYRSPDLMPPINDTPPAPIPEKKSLWSRIEAIYSCDIFWYIGIFLITAAAFSPALTFKNFILDDQFYFFNALSIESSFLRIFDPVLKLTTPLTSLSFYADYLIWGKNSFIFGAHLTNILLHCGTGVIFYLFLRSFKWGTHTLSPAWAGMTALIFTLHPQRVESVVWISERKDCLAMFLGLGALFLFWRALQKEKISWTGGLCLLLSFLAKPMWLFFFAPAAALIWMKYRSFHWKLYLKLLFPSLVLFIVFTLWLACDVFIPGGGSSNLLTPAALLLKTETIFYNYGNYFIRTFLPGNLFPLYPYYDPAYMPRWMALIPVGLLLTPFLARKQELRTGMLYGVLPLLICFAVLLIPVVGFIRVGNTDFADRYSYLPSLFLVAGSAFLLKLNIPKETAFGTWLPVLGLLYCGGLLHKMEQYLPVWKDAQTYIERSTLPKVPNFNAVIWQAVSHFHRSEFDKALKICREKLPENQDTPHHISPIFKLSLQGLILFKLGHSAEGIKYLNTVYMSPFCYVVSDFPIDFAQKVFTTGAEYHLTKYNDRKAAANLYMRCSVLFRAHASVYEAFYAGLAALAAQDYGEAVIQFRRAHTLNPSDPRCLKNLRFAENKLKESKR